MGKNNLQVYKDKLETTMDRVINAPREKVWQAHTDPKMIEQWWGPRKYTIVVEEFEPKVGGKWKFIHKAEGEEHVFYGEFKEIKEPEFITWTFTYAGYPDSVITETIHMEELPEGKTKIKTVSHYPSVEALDGMVQSGMEGGATKTWDRLEELVAK